MWKERKLGLQSTDKAKHENREELLKACQQGGALLCLQLWDPKYSFVFSPLLTQSTTWQGSYHLRSPFFFLPLGSGCPASSGGRADVAFVFGEKFPFLVFVYFCLKTFLVPIANLSL